VRSTIEPIVMHWAGSLRRWIGLAGAPGLLAAATSVLTLVGLSLAYRQLPTSQAGSLAILLSLSDIFGLFALLGGWTVTTRLYAPAGTARYNWPADLRAAALYAAPVVSGLTIGAAVLYGLPASSALYLWTVTLLATVLAASAAMLNARREHTWAAVALRAPNATFVLVGLFYLAVPHRAELSTALVVHLGATALTLAASVVRLNRVLAIGTERITNRQRWEGTAFLLSAMSDQGPEQGLTALAGWILPLDQVAAFAALSVLIRPFRLLRHVLATILSPDVIQHRRASYRRLLVGVWLLALGLGAAVVLTVPAIASWFYGSRYQEGLAWIPYMALAGVVHLGGMVPRIDLTSRAPMGMVSRFAVTYASAMAVALALSAGGLRMAGASFLGPAVALLPIAEALISGAFWLAFRRRDRGAPGTTA
jgi:hypothetical protein